MIHFDRAVEAWATADFEAVIKAEIEHIKVAELPLQQGMSTSSYAIDQPFQVMINHIADQDGRIAVKAGIFYAGIIAGCSCADDPTPVDEQTEYCELEFLIDRSTGQATVRLLPE